MGSIETHRIKADSYLKLLRSGEAKSIEVKILWELQKTPFLTNKDLIKLLNKPHQTITGRTSKLLDLGLIKAVGKVERGDRQVAVFNLVQDQAEIEYLIQKRWSHRKMMWVKKGEREGFM